jgi:16S rRNA (uracil1498-N3)-methyltransferase
VRRLHLESDEFDQDDGGEVRLVGARARRLREVLRIRSGATLQVFDGSGREREAHVSAMTGSGVVLTLGGDVEAAAEPPVRIVLACAFPKASRGDWLVEKATEIGVAQLVPTETDRSVMRAGEGRYARWQRIAIEAAEQCGRALIPLVGGEVPDDALHIVGDPDTAVTIRMAVAEAASTPQAIVLHIGPEGGWTQAELDAFDAQGAVRCSMGPRLMRIETAAIVAAAQLLELTGGLSPAGPSRSFLL